jgi:two-component system LytT family response regulator
MRHIRTLVVDDEKPARDRLTLALKAIPDIALVGEAVNGAQAVELIRELKPQLVFLDVQMPVMNGFEVLQHCKEMPAVVFTTAYDEYALRAFEVHAIDYLLKPYDKERLRNAVAHAVERLSVPSKQREDDGVSGLLSEYRRQKPFLTRLAIKRGGAYRIVPVDQVDFFKADDGLVFWVQQDERYLIDETLSTLEENLDPSLFLRLRRSAIANLDKIVRVIPLGRGRFAAEFPGGERIEVGRTRIDDFRKAMRLK